MRLLLCDEITSALDVSVQASVLKLVRELVLDEGLAAVFVSHNLAAVRSVCDRIAVMYQGRVVELDDTDRVLESPQHEYTKRLLAAVPELAR